MEAHETFNRIWSRQEKLLFRIAFVFFIIMAVPLEWAWFQRLFQIDLFDITYRDLYDISGYSPDFIRLSGESGRWGLGSYVNWGITLLIAIGGGLLWTALVRRREPDTYNKLYYWLRVVVRYRIAVGIIAFGFIKLFPQQMPYPSLTVLNTPLIDIQPQKLYWYSVGIVQKYEIFLGFVEVLGGILLFFRRTTIFGAVLVMAVLFNIGLANHAYDGGVHVYSFYFVLLSLFLLVHDFPRVWALLIKGKDTLFTEYVHAIHRHPVLKGIKYLILFIYIPFYTYVMIANNTIRTKINKKPITPALAGTPGFYNVTEFRLNNKVLPYDPLDSVRWQSAIFEKWSTLTYKVNKPVSVNLGNGSSAKKDVDKNFEVSGIAGGQRFFYYDADTVRHILYLQDKNTPNQNRRGRVAPDAPRRERPKLVWHYSRPSDSRIILSGRNDTKDSIYVVLDKVDKKYPLVEGRQLAQKY